LLEHLQAGASREIVRMPLNGTEVFRAYAAETLTICKLKQHQAIALAIAKFDQFRSHTVQIFSRRNVALQKTLQMAHRDLFGLAPDVCSYSKRTLIKS
jgi:hypothetical protein